tara:strand:+ start:343 stop:675 length:333 start_codon:yes stop_codon:yes gene_type:complete
MAHLNKKQIVLRLITPPKSPKGPYWSREYKILNSLMEKYPDKKFWDLLKFNEGWDSLVIFQSDFGKELLERKYKEWNYEIKESKKFELTKKIGPDIIIDHKPKNLRQFLS